MEEGNYSSSAGGWGHWASEGDLAAPTVVESMADVSVRVYVPYRLPTPVQGSPVAFVVDTFESALPASRFEIKDLETSASIFQIESSFNAPVFKDDFRQETFAMARAILYEHASTKIASRNWSCMVCSAPGCSFVHTAFLRRQIIHDEDTLDLDLQNSNQNPGICKTCIVLIDVAVLVCTHYEETPCYQEAIELSKKYAQRIMLHKDILVERPRKIEDESQKPFNNPSDISQPGMPMFKDCRFCRKSQATFACAACRKVGYCSFECQHEHWPEHKQYCVPLPAHDPDALPLLLSWLVGDNKYHYARLEERQRRYADLNTQRNRSKWSLQFTEGRHFTFNGAGILIETDPWADVGIEDRVVDEDARVQYGDDSRILLCLKRFGDEEASTERVRSTDGREVKTGLWQPRYRKLERKVPIPEQSLWQPHRSAGTSGTPDYRECTIPSDVVNEETWTSLSMSDMKRAW